MATRFGLLVLLQLSWLACSSHAQGLLQDPSAIVGAYSSYKSLNEYLRRSSAWRNTFRLNRASACSRSSGSLCAVAGTSPMNEAALALATAPQSYDLSNPKHTGGIKALSPILDQKNCFTCASFAVAAASDTAISLALNKTAKHAFSVQDLHFCASRVGGEVRDCKSPWTLQDALAALNWLQPQGKPTASNCLAYNPTAVNLCDYQCIASNAELLSGRKFEYKRLNGLVDVQQWIRTHGGVVTGIQIYPDFQPFYKSNPNGVYQGPTGPIDPSQEPYGHAVQVIGYNNDQQYWLAKNSWSPKFAVAGLFKIRYGASGICDPKNTWGIRFVPFQPAAAAAERLLSPVPNKAGCYNYKAQPFEYVEKVAKQFDMSVERVLLDNLGVISQPDMLLDGKTLVLCGIKDPFSPVVAGPPSPEPDATDCPACASKCKDCAVCAGAVQTCRSNRALSSCRTCADCQRCPTSSYKKAASYSSCGACGACADCCPQLYKGCADCAYCQYCKYCP